MSERPFLSVIVPAHNGHRVLPQSLEALLHSDLPRECWELIVVDDASTDDTAVLAARFADAVVRLPGQPHGPAYARNRGFEAARGEIIVFVDADVCVHPDALRRFTGLFSDSLALGAVFGSYDSRPAAPGLVSQYRNLLHHLVHHQNTGEAETFWAGCGAVRTAVFAECGMFDEWHYYKPQIEDIELGHRIRARGHRILLRPEIQGTHLKRWTLGNMVATDFKDRGVPWMRLLVNDDPGIRKGVLNVRTRERVSTVLVWLAFLCAGAAALLRQPLWLAAAALALAPVLYGNRSLYHSFRALRGWGFALAVLPLHLLYYLVNGLSAVSGILLHHVVGEPQPPASVQAFSEVGLETWPPVPSRRPRAPWEASSRSRPPAASA